MKQTSGTPLVVPVIDWGDYGDHTRMVVAHPQPFRDALSWIAGLLTHQTRTGRAT